MGPSSQDGLEYFASGGKLPRAIGRRIHALHRAHEHVVEQHGDDHRDDAGGRESDQSIPPAAEREA